MSRARARFSDSLWQRQSGLAGLGGGCPAMSRGPQDARPSDLSRLSAVRSRPSRTFLDISRLEGNGAVARMIGSIEGLPSARAPVDRIVFGSHAPYFPVETALLKLMESPLDAQQLEAIVQRNARRLLPQA